MDNKKSSEKTMVEFAGLMDQATTLLGEIPSCAFRDQAYIKLNEAIYWAARASGIKRDDDGGRGDA